MDSVEHSSQLFQVNLAFVALVMLSNEIVHIGFRQTRAHEGLVKVRSLHSPRTIEIEKFQDFTSNIWTKE